MHVVTALATGMVLTTLCAAGATQNTGSISGTITDTTGRGLPGATVTVASHHDGVRTTVTDTEGGFDVVGLAAGRHRIEVCMNGFERKISAVTVDRGRAAVWSGALLIAASVGEGSIERKVLGYTGEWAVDCGRHSVAASEADLQRSLACARTSVQAAQPSSIIVQSVADGSRNGHGLFAGSDGVIYIFDYERGGLSFQLQPCRSPQLTYSESGSRFVFTCQAPPG